MTLSSLWGRITGKDKGLRHPVQQTDVLGRIGDHIILSPYGLYTDLPNETLFKELDDQVDGLGVGDLPEG